MKSIKLKKTYSKSIVQLGILFCIGTAFVACSSDNDDLPEIINQEELITTVKIELVSENGGETVVLNYLDLDGNGPNTPEITGGTLNPNATYTGTVTLLNETVSPAENISEEVKEEGVDHQFFYSSTLNVTTTYLDMDKNGHPIGLAFKLNTNDIASGSFSIVLRHEPNKKAVGVQEGNMENAGGETDIFVTFPLSVN